MAWHAVPVAIMAGICLYAATLFVGLHVALAQVADRRARSEYLSFALCCLAVAAYDSEYLSFALCCLAVAAYDASSAALYNADTLERGILAQRAQVITAGAIGVTYVQFTWDIVKTSMPLLLRVARGVLVVLAVVGAFWTSPHTLTTAAPAIKHVQLGSTELVYYEGAPGILVQLLLLEFFILFWVTVVYLFRHFRKQSSEHVRGQRGFLIALIVSGICASNDIMVTSGLYEFVYAFEYGIAAILLAMGYLLLMRFGALHEAVNSLNRELSRANAELSTALDRARESVRVKTEFLASMSHELRTPLNAIINLPEGVLEDIRVVSIARCSTCASEFQLDAGESLLPSTACETCGTRGLALDQQLLFTGDAARARSCLWTVVRAGKHLLGLVNDILSASKLELGRAEIQPEPVHVGELVREVVDSAQTVASQKQVQIRVHEAQAEAGGPIVADRVKLAQVLYNLIGNAVKFSGDGAVVEVQVSAPAKDRRLFCVRDHGVGIAREHHEVIFEKFRQVDAGATRAHGGTGLGLAISKSLVELHGGRIWVESAKGQGASFFVELPTSGAS